MAIPLSLILRLGLALAALVLGSTVLSAQGAGEPEEIRREDLIQPDRQLTEADLTAADRARQDLGGQQSLGSGMITTALMDSLNEINSKVAPEAGVNPASLDFSNFKQEYESANGPPYLAYLGFKLEDLLSDGAFRALTMFALLLFSGFAIAGTFEKARNGQATLEDLGTLIVKVFLGALLIANLSTVYAIARTLSSSGQMAVSAILNSSNQRLTDLKEEMQENGVGAASLDSIEATAIKNALSSRSGFLAANADNPTKDRWLQLAMLSFAEDLDQKQSRALDRSTGPRINPPESATTDTLRVHNNDLLQRIVLNSKDLEPNQDLDTTFTFVDDEGNSEQASVEVTPLSDYLEEASRVREELETLPGSSTTSDVRKELQEQYGELVFEATQAWIDKEVLNNLAAEAPDDALANIDWLGQRKRSIWEKIGSAGASAFASSIEAVVSFARTVLQMFVQLISLCVAWFYLLLAEISIVSLAIAYPLWLWPSTSNAFTKSFERVFTHCLVLPVFQFLMVLVDGIFVKAFGFLLAGGIAVGIGSGGVGMFIIPLAGTIVWGVAYIAVAVFLLWKTPSILASFLKDGTGLGKVFAAGIGGAGAAAAATVLAPLAGAFAIGAKAGLAGGAAGGASAGALGGGWGALAGASKVGGVVGKAGAAFAKTRGGQTITTAARTAYRAYDAYRSFKFGRLGPPPRKDPAPKKPDPSTTFF